MGLTKYLDSDLDFYGIITKITAPFICTDCFPGCWVHFNINLKHILMLKTKTAPFVETQVETQSTNKQKSLTDVHLFRAKKKSSVACNVIVINHNKTMV